MVKEYDTLLLGKVTAADEKLVLLWTNDPVIRKWSFNSNAITSSGHKKWFKRKLNDQNTLMWILEDNNRPAGLVRLEKENNGVVLNYLIAPKERGKGLAKIMLEMAMDMKEDYWGNNKVLAYTLPKNIPSIKSLEKVGFFLVDSTGEKSCYVFYKTKKVDTGRE